MLKGKIAIVSGAAQGLGEAFARRLAHEGATVLAFDVQDKIKDVATKIAAETGSKVVGMKADVSKRADVEKVVAAAADLGGIDILVNNAGTWKKTPVDTSWDQAVADWDFIMDTNFKGVLMLTRASVPHMKARGGDIVNISTYYVMPARSDGTNQPDTDLYNASKWALNGFTDSWAKALEEFNIRVNALCMGATDTPMLRGLFPDKQLPADMASVVMKPEQIAQQMIDLFKDGRTGENIGAWVGYPVELGPRKAAHKRISGVA
ncbi:SDR family oxidoreductase [Iodidimonas sp. SYSU 1G8]|uniref:SDR family NAD(P)-dependent oxidoreductase n=1 Tax=Iodidimonas sp. SYSU 1G8 TaxID=3133967 RepID=UPI0031FEFBE3